MEREPKAPLVLEGGSSTHFIREIVREEVAQGKHGGRVATRFPPEPNGYLHIGHAKAICLDFGIAEEFGGTCNLRYDDTNPTTEDVEYVNAIEEDIRWLGFKWAGKYYASDYFEQLYEYACMLIRKGKAYVDSLTEDEIREYRGNFYRKGVESPYRNRSVEENLNLFQRMRAGEFPDGSHVLRAKIDLSSQNMNMRDPIMYRIKKVRHHRTGDKWCIYPMYDFAHPLSDAIERITHSICTLEFEAHRPLYDWFIRECEAFPSRQIEFARLNLTYTVMSKRKLLELVQKGLVSGWDDPRMPTLAGLRRRGYTPEAIRAFCERIGVSKADSVVDVALLEHAIREDLERRAPRAMMVQNPVRVVIENFPEGQVEWLDAPNHPDNPAMGTRKIPFTRTLYVERDDFREDPPPKWYRLSRGREVRLRWAYLVTCSDVVKDAQGEVVELRCVYDPASRGGNSPDGRVVKGTIHWVSADYARDVEVRLYDRLFNCPDPSDDFLSHLNPDSLKVIPNAKAEPSLIEAEPGSHWQMERVGYFCVDTKDSVKGRPVFNRTVPLKDSWAKLESRLVQSTPPQRTSVTVPVVAMEAREDLKPIAEEITFDAFARLDLRVGIVRAAEPVEGAKKLIRLMVDIAEGRLRQIFAGIRGSYKDPSSLVGKRVVVVANLKPREMKWGVSEGMILAGGNDRDGWRVVTLDDGDVKAGDPVS